MERSKVKFSLFSLVLIGIFFAAPLRADILSTIAKVKPSVVIVCTFKNTNSPRFSLKGTGFVVEPGSQGRGNLVITNAPVIHHPVAHNPDADLVIQIRVGPTELNVRPAGVP